MKQTVKKYIALLILALAFVFIISGIWIKTKPLLAEVLLARAWKQTVDMGKPVKAWPWADTWPVARLEVERLGIDRIILEGDSGEVLAFGPGHVIASARPLEKGNCVLVGHRDTSFTFLQKLQPGDRIVVESSTKKSGTYQVHSIQVVPADQLHFQEIDETWLTLITCYPFETVAPGAKKRYVIFAKSMNT